MSVLPIALLAIFLVVGLLLSSSIYKSYMIGIKRTAINTMIGLTLGLIAFSAIGYTAYSAYNASGPTTYAINASGVIIQGSSLFDITDDPAGLFKVTSINWGNLDPGSTAIRHIYITNKGSQPMTATIDIINWSPALASQYLQVSWNFGASELGINRVRLVEIILTVLPSIHDVVNFQFDVVVTGTTA